MFARTTIVMTFSALSAGLCSAQIDFDPAQNLGVAERPDTTVVADFDGNGTADMATTADTQDRVVLHFGDGAGQFGAPLNVLLGNNVSPSALVAADFDGDLDIDLAVALKQNQVMQFLMNDGLGNFSFGVSAAVGVRPVVAVARDLDGDGDVDVAVSNRDGNDVSVLTNNGGSFASANYPVGAEPRGISADDYDGDGDIDLAVGIHDDRSVRILNNVGGTSYVSGPSLSVGAQRRPEGVASADLDGDGDADLLAATSGNGFNSVSVWLQSAGAMVGPVHYAAGGQNPSRLTVADYDLDGALDVAVSCTDSNQVAALPGAGAGSFGAAVLFAAGVNPDHLAQGDFDGNGGMDLVSSNSDGNSLSVFVNQNGGENSWTDLGFGLAGSLGVPSMTGTGILAEGNAISINISGALPSGRGLFFVGPAPLFAPFKGGVLVPDPDFVWINQRLDAAGSRTYSASWPAGIAAGTEFYFQFWTLDANAVEGLSATNGLLGTAR